MLVLILPLVTWFHSLDLESPYYAASGVKHAIPVIFAVHFQACAYDVVVRQAGERDLEMTLLRSSS